MINKLRVVYSLLLLFPWMFLTIGCSYLMKNEKHLVYSKPKYGQDRFAVVQHYNIHYVEIGEGQPVLLIPGSFSTYRNWNRMMPLFSKDYKLLAIDYLGVGDSDKPQSGFYYTIEEQADLIAKMIEQLGISNVHIVGVSYGGAIALNLGARYPDKVGKIVCVEGAVIKPKKIPFNSMRGFLKWPLIGDISVGVVRSGLFDKSVTKLLMGKAWDTMNSDEKREVTEIVSQNNKMASRVSWYCISHTIKTSKNFAEEAKTIRAPVLYFYSQNSDFRDMAEKNVDFLKAHLTDVEIVYFKDGIHDLELQKPKEMTNFILKFLSKGRANEHN
jgi:pimeloyl-ACP methyl ester carboxylesterase